MPLKPKGASRETAAPGFQFPRPTFESYTNPEVFRKALHEQAASVEVVDATVLSDLDLSGRVLGFEGDRLTLTRGAFGQFCHICKLPRSYVESLARRDELLALQVMHEAATSMLRRDRSKVLVADSRTGLVHAIVDREGYNFAPNDAVLDLALSAGDDVRLNRGFIDGLNARITVVDEDAIAEPQVGDVVRFGSDLMTDVGSETFLTARSYNERLKCTNGMTVRDSRHVVKLSARADVGDALPSVMVELANRRATIGPMMQESATLFLDEKRVDGVLTYLSDPKHGGSAALMRAAALGAQSEARNDGRDDGELTLWDFVNGITAEAKLARTLNRRTDLEALGYDFMRNRLSAFGVL